MNVFEIFGFFLLGAMFNLLLVTILVKLVINSIKKAINQNVNNLSDKVGDQLKSINDLINLFKKEKIEND